MYEKKSNSVCDLSYLIELMNGKSKLILGIIDVFLEQFPGELESLNKAVTAADFPLIKSLSHHMKSSISIVGISALTLILKEMEGLGEQGISIDRIKELFCETDSIGKLAVKEMEIEKVNYAK